MLKTLAASNASPGKHIPLLKSVLNGVRITAITINNDILYRSRWNKETALYRHTDELRYPDKKVITNKGRLNDIGESILYAAACELGTIIESRPVLNKLFTISLIKPLNSDLLYFPL